MKYRILSTGRLKRGAEFDLCDDYLKRIKSLGRQIGLSSLTIKEWAECQADTAELRQRAEADVLLAELDQGTARPFVIVLDERGVSVSSHQLATVLQKQAAHAKDIVFCIGGPDGHAYDVRAQADLVLSFGAMTWPHRLVRVMLLEQIYRAVTILLNHPYHRS